MSNYHAFSVDLSLSMVYLPLKREGIMRIEKQLTDEKILEELGSRVAQRRIQTGLTQSELAEEAGVSRATLVRIEDGQETRMSTMIRILRRLDLLSGLDQAIPEAQLGPMDQLKQREELPQRVSRKRRKERQKPWLWGDQQ
jgi:DNA-binding XRE family transcriptional regulator